MCILTLLENSLSLVGVLIGGKQFQVEAFCTGYCTWFLSMKSLRASCMQYRAREPHYH